MGMNGYLGVRFMLAEITPSLHPGDIVVLAFEYDSFVKSVDGTGVDLWMLGKSRPENFLAMTWAQRAAAVAALPFIDQQKLLRLLRGSAGPGPRAEPDLDAIESLAGFNQYGDLVSHLGVRWPMERESGLDLTALPLDPELVPLLSRFATERSSQGVKVLMSYGPVIRTFYALHQRAIAQFHRAVSAAAPLVVISEPSDFVYDEPFFFDTVYHLNEAGRALRTARLSEQLGPHLAH
jgi:hypothetical protein